MKKQLLIVTLSFLTVFIGSSFRTCPRKQNKSQNDNNKYYNELAGAIQKIRKECYWQIEILEPQILSEDEKNNLSTYRNMTIGFGPKLDAPQYHILKVDFINERRCPRFNPNSKLTITLQDGKKIEANAPLELNKEPSRNLFAGSFREQGYYLLPTVQLYEILSSPSFILEAEGEVFNVKASFNRKDL